MCYKVLLFALAVKLGRGNDGNSNKQHKKVDRVAMSRSLQSAVHNTPHGVRRCTSLGPRLSSSFSSLAVRKSDEKLDESLEPRLSLHTSSTTFNVVSRYRPAEIHIDLRTNYQHHVELKTGLSFQGDISVGHSSEVLCPSKATQTDTAYM